MTCISPWDRYKQESWYCLVATQIPSSFCSLPLSPREQIPIFSSTLSPHCAPHHGLSGTLRTFSPPICLFPRQDVVMNSFLDELTREIRRTGKWGHPELKCRCQDTMIQNNSLPVYLQTNHISSFSFIIRKKNALFHRTFAQDLAWYLAHSKCLGGHNNSFHCFYYCC